MAKIITRSAARPIVTGKAVRFFGVTGSAAAGTGGATATRASAGRAGAFKRRGAVLDDLDHRALRSGVEAAGKNLWVANYATEIPETVLAPALLFSDVTVKRANETNDKLPYYPPPN